MNRLKAVLLAFAIVMTSFAGNCSRARVESLQKMNDGVILAQSKRFMEAVENFEEATVMDPTNEEAFYNLAMVHMEMNNFERARDDLQRAIQLNGDRAGYHEKLGTVLMELGQHNEAKAAFEAAIAADPELFKAYYKLAQCYEALEDPQNALHQYTLAIQKGPRFLPAYNQLGRLYANLTTSETDYLDEAVQVLQGGLTVAQEGSEEKAGVHHLLGTVYQQQRNYEGAVAEFRAALDIEPGMQDALFSIGWTYALQNQREEARRYLKKFVEGGAEAPPHYLKAAQDRLSELQQAP